MKENQKEKYLGIFDKETVRTYLKYLGIIGVGLLGVAAFL